MHISIITIGSRGDVQPYIALSIGLQKAGHQVQIIADVLFKDLILEKNLRFTPIYTNPKKVFDEDISKIGKNFLQFSKFLRDNYKKSGRKFFKEILDAVDSNTDVIVFSGLAATAFHIAEFKKIPCIGTYLQPYTPTREFGPVISRQLPSWFPFKSYINWSMSRFNSKMYFYLTKDILNEWRVDILNLPALPWQIYSNVDISDFPILYGYSKHVIPKPSDWKDNLYVTGYWYLENESNWQPPKNLLDFIKNGTRPIYFGFGSMIDKEIITVTNIIIEALKKTDQRGIISSGWNELNKLELPSNVLLVKDIPHEWLFPRMAAVVHHGGAGTTAAGLKAGVPAIVVPFSFDQPFWGRKVFELGVGPKPIPRKKLSVDKLAKAIEQVINTKEFPTTAKILSEKIQAEDGISNAVSIIEKLISN